MTLFGGKPSADGGSKQLPATRQKVGESRAARGEETVRVIRSGVRNIVSEMKRVTWPSRDEWVSATVVVFGLVVVVSIWTFAISRLVERLFKF